MAGDGRLKSFAGSLTQNPLEGRQTIRRGVQCSRDGPVGRVAEGRPAMPTEALIDVDQAADRLGVSVRWIRRAVAQRTIPFIKVGHYVRFEPSALDAYVDTNRVDAQTPWLRR